MVTRAYQVSRTVISANSAIRSRYDAAAARTASSATALEKLTVPGCQYQAGPQPLYVPFPWTRKRLVEVVNVEQQRSLWRSEPPKFARWQSPHA